MTITLDFETRGTCDLPRVGQMRYALDPATQALCMCWTYDDDEEIRLWHRNHPWIEKSERPDELIERIRDGEIVEAHNAGFEFWIWNETLRREFPEFDVEIKLEFALLAENRIGQRRQRVLEGFSHWIPVRREEQVFHQLLRNRRRAAP